MIVWRLYKERTEMDNKLSNRLEMNSRCYRFGRQEKGTYYLQVCVWLEKLYFALRSSIATSRWIRRSYQLFRHGLWMRMCFFFFFLFVLFWSIHRRSAGKHCAIIGNDDCGNWSGILEINILRMRASVHTLH